MEVLVTIVTAKEYCAQYNEAYENGHKEKRHKKCCKHSPAIPGGLNWLVHSCSGSWYSGCKILLIWFISVASMISWEFSGVAWIVDIYSNSSWLLSILCNTVLLLLDE